MPALAATGKTPQQKQIADRKSALKSIFACIPASHAAPPASAVEL
jgi:hypothetical protein